MKAWVLSKNGIDNLSLTEIERPKIGRDQVLIKVKAVGLNPIDSMVVDFIPVSSPIIPGAEFSGEIAEIGEDVAGFNIGEKVTVYPRYFDGSCKYCLSGNEMLCDNGYIMGVSSNAGLAEYAAVDSKNVFKLPDKAGFETGASLSVAALTSYNALERADLKKGEFIAVIGAGGNTGMFAIQFAKKRGAKVIAVSSKGWLKEFGADYVVDYKNAAEEVKNITDSAMADVVVDSIGEKLWGLGYSILGKGGRIVVFGTETGKDVNIDLSQLYSRQLKIIGSTGGAVHQFSEVVKNSSDLKVKVWKKFKFEDTKSAFQAMKDRNKDGRIIIEQ